tara:strand:- start:37374 stop:37553 length:180 start_codon:yes stop_codon:yes gene_type:complete
MAYENRLLDQTLIVPYLSGDAKRKFSLRHFLNVGFGSLVASSLGIASLKAKAENQPQSD